MAARFRWPPLPTTSPPILRCRSITRDSIQPRPSPSTWRWGFPWGTPPALLTVYIVLGMLYESTIHPITILSTLPSAGVGAILAIMLSGNDLNVIAMIGIILLIGIVKKNAIMMIDFALETERRDN